MILTDVNYLIKNWQQPNASAIMKIHVHKLKSMTFDSGSMGPKVQAVCQFVKRTKKIAHIGLLSDASELLAQTRLTSILP